MFRQTDLLQLMGTSDWKFCTNSREKVIYFTSPEDINTTVATYMQRGTAFFSYFCNDLATYYAPKPIGELKLPFIN